MVRQFAAGLLAVLLLNPAISQANPAAGADLPDLASFSINDNAEHLLGRQFLRELRHTTPLREDPLLGHYLENLCYRLAFAGALTTPDLQVVLIPDRRINAFAVPGGVIGLNEGLLLYADHEAEVAAVLAHELAHINQHHYARSQEGSTQNSLLYLGAILASIALASATNSDAGLALGMSTQAAMAQQQLSYSRQHEREADNIGMQTLVSAGFSAEAMPDFFSKMDKQARQVGLMPEFLLTHPITQDRIADSALRARAYHGQGSNNSLDYQLIRARLLAMINPEDRQTIAALRQRLHDNPDNVVDRLALAFALMNAGQYEQARAEVKVLLTAKPSQLDYVIASADIDLAANQPADALATLKQALLLSPDSAVLQLYAARAAILNQQAADALALLTPLLSQRAEDPVVWRTLMEAHQQLKDALGVLRSRAEYLFLSGQGETALKDLEQAEVLAQTNYPLAAKISQRRKEIQDVLALQKK